jgi:ABC-type multidrug transport system fused ATPase/permease subunit
MNSLAFIITRSLKNSLAELPRRPAKLVMYSLALLLILGMFFLSQRVRQGIEPFVDLIWLKGAFFAYLMFDVGIFLQKGLSTGDAIFEMSDVNLLFVSPLKPRAILVYGLARMIKMALYTVAFILFESGAISLFFGLGFDAALLLMLGGCLAVFVLILLSFAIYSVSNGRPRRKGLVKLFALGAFLPLGALGALEFFQTGDGGEALKRVLDSPVLAWTPVAGWTAEGTAALIRGEPGRGLFFLGLLLASGVLLVLYAAFSRPDYYEDVLVAAETSFERKGALAQGRLPLASSVSPKARRAGTGLGGYGAAAVFYKHLRESFRENPLGLWGLSSLLWVAIAVAMTFFMRNDENDAMATMSFLMFVQMSRVGLGRGIRELYSPYLYLIPESPFAKILWNSLELVLKTLGEALFIFVAIALILDIPPLIALEEALVYVLFTPLLLGVNLLSLRWTGSTLSSVVFFFLYLLATLLIALPGLIGALIADIFLGLPAALGIFAAWELLAALGCFALSRGILHHCDMPVVKTNA